MNRLWWVLAALLSLAAVADDFDDLFSDETFDIELDPTLVQVESRSWYLGGATQLSTHYNTRKGEGTAIEQAYTGLSQLAIEQTLDFDWRVVDWLRLRSSSRLAYDAIFTLTDRPWSPDDREHREWLYQQQLLVTDLSFRGWQLSVGQQVVSLGTLDAMSTLNQVSARDMSTPGLLDIDSMQVPGIAADLAGSMGPMRLRFGLLFDHQANQLPIAGTDFALAINPLLSQLQTSQPKPAWEELDNLGAYAVVAGVLSKLDWQVVAASLMDHQGYILAELQGMQPVFTRQFARTQLVGAGFSYALGALLLKAEINHQRDLATAAYQTLGMMSLPLAVVPYDQNSLALGVDADTGTWGRFVIEMQASQVIDFDDLPASSLEKGSAQQWALMYQKALFRDALTIGVQWIGFGFEQAAQMRSLGLDYDYSDHISLHFGLVDYKSGDPQLMSLIGDNDRWLAKLNYHW